MDSAAAIIASLTGWRAPEHLAARPFFGAEAVARVRLRFKLTCVLGIVNQRPKALGHVDQRAFVLGARLRQEYAISRVLTQPAGQHTARRTSTHDYYSNVSLSIGE
jgi:hypothetical protein